METNFSFLIINDILIQDNKNYMNKKHLIIISCILLIGLVAGVWQYIETFKVEIASAARTAGVPNPGHAWSTIECSTSNMCVDTSGVGIGTNAPAGKLHIVNSGFNPVSNATGGLIMDGAYGGGLIFKDTAYAGIWTSNSGQTLNFGVNGSSGGFGSATGKMSILSTGQIRVCDSNSVCGILQVKCYAAPTDACYILYDPS